MGSSEERAVRDFVDIVNELYNGLGKEFGKSFRSRAREIPSFIYEVGFLSAVSFVYSKAETQRYNLIIKYVEEKKRKSPDYSIYKDINSTEGGYAAYLYLLLLETSRILPNMNLNLSDPLSCIKALSGHGDLLMVLPSLLMPYLLEIKRLAEAILPKEE